MKIPTLLKSAALALVFASVGTPALASDDACMRCHKRNGAMEGAHGNIGANGLSCVRCHGDQDGHPRNKEAMIYFGEGKKTDVVDQNQTCVRCHRPDKLRDADWTHDVHLNTLSCAACHQLHPSEDPMANLEKRERTALCVDCHGAMTEQEDN
ncbi:cytochrome c3 family protein [Ferrimonas marina]|uniref:Cytochrome c-type protein NrfB n=1 Tax=Ferrimonas marina TaxID=299255 RepID=A0A1M5X4M8_9GAMM|nr:cytochrome c3 family protein [Ferrimonas marina]SHH94751.1 cytochrome c-type protein NrfB [Ferrimonas marina]